MMADTETITVTLFQSVDGLCAEVDGLPVQSGPEYLRIARQRECAEEALRAHYPELIVCSASAVGETGYLLFVEHL